MTSTDIVDGGKEMTNYTTAQMLAPNTKVDKKMPLVLAT